MSQMSRSVGGGGALQALAAIRAQKLAAASGGGGGGGRGDDPTPREMFDQQVQFREDEQAYQAEQAQLDRDAQAEQYQLLREQERQMARDARNAARAAVLEDREATRLRAEAGRQSALDERNQLRERAKAQREKLKAHQLSMAKSNREATKAQQRGVLNTQALAGTMSNIVGSYERAHSQAVERTSLLLEGGTINKSGTRQLIVTENSFVGGPKHASVPKAVTQVRQNMADLFRQAAVDPANASHVEEHTFRGLEYLQQAQRTDGTTDEKLVALARNEFFMAQYKPDQETGEKKPVVNPSSYFGTLMGIQNVLDEAYSLPSTDPESEGGVVKVSDAAKALGGWLDIGEALTGKLDLNGEIVQIQPPVPFERDETLMLEEQMLDLFTEKLSGEDFNIEEGLELIDEYTKGLVGHDPSASKRLSKRVKNIIEAQIQQSQLADEQAVMQVEEQSLVADQLVDLELGNLDSQSNVLGSILENPNGS